LDGTVTKRRRSGGFSLIELVIAVSLSTIVLIGVFSMMTSMVQLEVAGQRGGTVNAWSLASLVAMNREIEGASVVVYPTAGTADALVLCSN
jgi:type II secretory pathway component PulJ